MFGLVLAGVVLLTVGGAQAEFITNGDFEDGLNGWYNEGYVWATVSNEYVSADHSAKITSVWYELSQVLSDLPSNELTLSYYAKDLDSSWPELYVTIREVTEPKNGTMLYTYADRPAGGWTYFSHTFTLPAEVTDVIVSFQWTRWGNQVYMDNVSLTPEPATIGLLAVGGLAILRRKR